MSDFRTIPSVLNLPASPAPAAPAAPEGDHAKAPKAVHGNAFTCPRDFLNNRFVYLALSTRAGGLLVGVNLNPDRYCNFDCVYCEVDRRMPLVEPALDVAVMAEELERTIMLVQSGAVRDLPAYASLPAELLTLRHVALSGDGEPTLSRNFTEAVESVVHVRARGTVPFFKIVLITNATGLDLPAVKKSLKLMTESDEVWCKLDAGSQTYMDRVNHPQVPLTKVLANIRTLARQRPVVIQSLFPMLEGVEPAEDEVEQYVRRLKELKAGGAMIPLVQIYSATRPMCHAECRHLPLKSLSHIAKLIRTQTGLKAEVF